MRGVAREVAADQFHQRHHRHRVEEVHADEAVGARGGGGQLRDRDRRGVRRDDHLGAHQLVHLLEDLELERVVLGGGLDDELRALQVVVVGRALDQRQRGGLLLGRELFLLDQAVEAARDGGDALVDGGLGHVDHHHVDARYRAGLGDAVAHGAGADDAHSLNRHEKCSLKQKKKIGGEGRRKAAVAQWRSL
ncbi:hypothetical protein FQZ97_802890 [compost metagenome]